MTEVNGLLTYDRVPKLPANAIRKVNTFNFPAPTYKVLLPTAEVEPQQWRYTTAIPNGEWSSPSFDDSN